MNHAHDFGARHCVSQLKIEGIQGAAVAKMGVNLSYPHGEPDALELASRRGDWTTVPLRGSWFLEAFEGPMSNLQRVLAGEDEALVSSVEDAFRTMAVVEACYPLERERWDARTDGLSAARYSCQTLPSGNSMASRPSGRISML